MRTRHVLALTPLLAACGPDEADYAQAYQERWCDVLDTQCPPDVLPDACRPNTLPDVLDPEPPLSGCTYDTFAANRCLTSTAWACTTEGDIETVEPPPVCATVWTCE